jgi:HK97 family phage major capsid protein
MLEGTTNSNTIDYYAETTSTNAAAETAEDTTYPESAEAWTLVTENVRDIGHFIPATRDSIDDVDWLEGTVRARLAFGVRRREELQLLVGDGTAPNISGILDRSGIQTMALGADARPDAVYKAMQLVRGSAGSGFAEPTGVVAHPADWTDVRLTKTTDGQYLFGGPAAEGLDRIWGLPVRQTTALTQNTVLVGAFRPHAQIFRRAALTITLSSEHSDYFVKRKVAIMAEERIALAIYRVTAFCTITGM